MNEPVGIVKKITIGGIDNFPIEQFVRLKEGTLLYTHPVNPYQSITNTKIEPTVVSYTHPVKEQGNPVAWRSQAPDGYWSVYQSPVEGAEPLYTGFKELTDAEIDQVIEEITGCGGKWNIVDLIKASLKKASEK